MESCINIVFADLSLLSIALGFWQWTAALRFPLHERRRLAANQPAITLLKPLRECNETTLTSLRSWLMQTYAGRTQILFGVADDDDPVCDLVRQLLEEFPQADARLVICDQLHGTNAKVSTLIQLEQLAKHELILVSDADVRVPQDFLGQMVVYMNAPGVALVNCFYRLANPSTWAMHWETISVNVDFWSQVLQSTILKAPDFALGAVMLTRRSALLEIGGFAAFADCLADDYQLGRRLVEKGHRIALGLVVVECWDKPMNWREVWKHQLRWARTIRVCRPLPYFMSILANATLWPSLWLITIFPLTHYSIIISLPIGCLAARVFFAWHLQRRFTPDRKLVSPLWLVPVKDLLSFAIWSVAFLGDKIEWQGRRMRLRRDGTMVPA